MGTFIELGKFQAARILLLLESSAYATLKFFLKNCRSIQTKLPAGIAGKVCYGDMVNVKAWTVIIQYHAHPSDINPIYTTA
jgi:hypothetical protein